MLDYLSWQNIKSALIMPVNGIENVEKSNRSILNYGKAPFPLAYTQVQKSRHPAFLKLLQWFTSCDWVTLT
jgi:hypothetical protein